MEEIKIIKFKPYINVRCKKCRNILSIKNPNLVEALMTGPYLNIKLTHNYHNCPEGIDNDEFIVGEGFSVSEKPLENAYEVIEIIK